MAVALGTVIMALGAIIEVVDLSLAAIASLLTVIILIEVGGGYPWLVWLGTSLATFLVFPGSTVWLMYFAFGVFPILKYYIEKLKRPLWFILKLLYVNLMAISLIYLVELIFGLPFFEEGSLLIVKVLVYLLLIVAFFAYDRLLTLFARLYADRLRQRFKQLFK